MTKREMGKAGKTFMGLLIAAFILLIMVFAFQTYGLVSGLFPADNIFMQGVTVFSFDGCCLIYAGLELFYIYKSRGAKELTGVMWFVTFTGSLLCTIAYMNLSSDHLLHTIVDPRVLIAAYALVTLVFAGDIVAITYILRLEWAAYLAEKYGEENERTAILSQMPQPTTSERASFAQTATIDAETARVQRLLAAARQKGYSIEQLEKILALPSGNNGSGQNGKSPK